MYSINYVYSTRATDIVYNVHSIYMYNHTAEGIVLVYACVLRLLAKYEEALIILQCSCVCVCVILDTIN